MYRLLLVFIGTLTILFSSWWKPNMLEYHTKTELPTATSTKETQIYGDHSTTSTPTSTIVIPKASPKITVVFQTPSPVILPTQPKPIITPIKLIYGLTPEECSSRINSSSFYYDPSMQSVKKVQELSDNGNTEDAKILREISCTPQAIWLSGQDSNFTKEKIIKVINTSILQNKIPVFVLYNGPNTEALGWQHIQSGESYRTWIRLVADTIGDSQAWIVLEPDALALSYNLSENDRISRLAELNGAVSTLVTYAPNARVYIDAGHSNWKSENIAADYLLRAGVKFAYGFSLNVSNYQTTDSQIEYGKKLSVLISGKHFIIDTSRNGNGAPIDNEWCNPGGRALGQVPTKDTKESIVDAFLWIKLPGESDGYCNGGTSAGKFWVEYALSLVKNQK
jgi:endoglucanase